MFRRTLIPFAAAALFAFGGVRAVADTPATPDSGADPVPDCSARVGYDREQELPGYLLPTAAGPRTCIPFTTVAARPPARYHGDFYVREFSDAKLRRRWSDCRRAEPCRERVSRQIDARRPPTHRRPIDDPRARFLLGVPDEPAEGELDLASLRRPAFFAPLPYAEPIAALDARTLTVEFAVPPDTYERAHHPGGPGARLRGWYIRGDGVADGRGGKRRALVVMTGGGGTRIAAIEDARDTLYRLEPDGTIHANTFPNATTGSPGQIVWRRMAADLVRAGFDVLLYDRRGAGISSGFSDTNTLQQGRDILTMIDALRTGTGLRASDAGGVASQGPAAARAVRGADPRRGLPVLLIGNSRGSMATGWAMTVNFDKDCGFDHRMVACRPARGDRHILGAMLIAEFVSGVGYVPANTTADDEARGLGHDRGLFIAGSETGENIVFFPSSAILAGMHTWPSVFLAKGLWDYASALQGTVDAYRRVPGRKELMVVRGPHPFEVWPESERRRLTDRLIAFGLASITGRRDVPGARAWHDLRSLVATTSDVWERSTLPTVR